MRLGRLGSAARATLRGLRRGLLFLFDSVIGGPGRVTEIDAHNAFNPYSADYDPASRRITSGRGDSRRGR
jgi:hypothetical protein